MKAVITRWYTAITLRWIIIGASVYLLTVVFGLMFFLGPNLSNYKETLAELETLSDVYVDVMSIDFHETSDIEAQIDELNTMESIFRERLLDSKNVNTIIPKIDSYCSQSNLVITKLEPDHDGKPIPPAYKKQFVETNLIGSYSNFLRFLNKLESNNEWILIEQLNIKPIEESRMLRFDLVLAVMMEL